MFLLPTVSVYHHSNFCDGLRNFETLHNEQRGHWKRVCDFLVINSNLGPILHTVSDIWHLIAGKSKCPYLDWTFQISRWPLINPHSPWAIRWWIFCDPSLHHFDTMPACDDKTCWRQLVQGSIRRTPCKNWFFQTLTQCDWLSLM